MSDLPIWRIFIFKLCLLSKETRIFYITKFTDNEEAMGWMNKLGKIPNKKRLIVKGTMIKNSRKVKSPL